MTRLIASQRLLIRPLQLDDSAAVFRYRSNADVVRFQMWKPQGKSDVRQFIRKLQTLAPGMPGIWYQYAIVLQQSGELIGDCGIHVPLTAADTAELGMTLAPEFQGKGYAEEALRALIRYCFETLHMHMIVARTVPQNTRSIALIDKMGFQPSRPDWPAFTPEKGELIFVLDHHSWEQSGD